MLTNHLLTYPSLVNTHIYILLYYIIYIYKVIQFLYIQVMTSCGTSPPKHQLLRWRPSGAWLSPLRRPRPGVSEGSPAAEDLVNLVVFFLADFDHEKSGVPWNCRTFENGFGSDGFQRNFRCQGIFFHGIQWVNASLW